MEFGQCLKTLCQRGFRLCLMFLGQFVPFICRRSNPPLLIERFVCHLTCLVERAADVGAHDFVKRDLHIGGQFD
jgi:hypothetical protein